MPSEVPDFRSCSADESAKRLTLYWNEVGEQTLRELLVYDQKRKDGDCVKGVVMAIARQDA